MSNNGLNYVNRLFDTNGEIKDWESNKSEFNLENKILFSWMQLIDSIPVSCPHLPKHLLFLTTVVCFLENLIYFYVCYKSKILFTIKYRKLKIKIWTSMVCFREGGSFRLDGC